jgi:hypothetical protein
VCVRCAGNRALADAGDRLVRERQECCHLLGHGLSSLALRIVVVCVILRVNDKTAWAHGKRRFGASEAQCMAITNTRAPCSDPPERRFLLLGRLAGVTCG